MHAGATVQVDTSALGQGRVHFVQDLLHLSCEFRQAVIADRLSQVGHCIRRVGSRKQALVRCKLARLGQVDEAVDARIEQAPQAS